MALSKENNNKTIKNLLNGTKNLKLVFQIKSVTTKIAFNAWESGVKSLTLLLIASWC